MLYEDIHEMYIQFEDFRRANHKSRVMQTYWNTYESGIIDLIRRIMNT